ncbi:MgtC/SapB family protein [Acidihalobacter prosperus]
MNALQHALYHIGVALAIGLLIGTERGWKSRELKEGERVAGIRSYGLIGLLGGGSAILAEKVGPIFLGLVFVGLSGILTTAYVMNMRRETPDVGITSLVSALLTFVLGALAGMGEVIVASASAVIMTLLLSYKPVLHHWLGVLEGKELLAIIKLLLISVVLLPILPNRGYGPGQALNPYEIWWMVVLIAAISFVGYFAVKIVGPKQGILFTGLFGGLASSTAVTLHLSRLSRQDANMASILVIGVLLACGTMFLRILLVACIINPDLLIPLLLPLSLMAIFTYLPTILYWRTQRAPMTDAALALKNPLELRTALGFGLLLACVMMVGKALLGWFGHIGVFVVSAASGMADVDAITLWLSRMTHGHIATSVAVAGIVIAAAVNNIVKGFMILTLGGNGVALRAGLPLLGSTVGGLVTVWILYWRA